MAVNFENNWKNILDKLESILESEFKGALPVYKGKDVPKGISQALQLIPTGSVLSDYNATSETREFSVTVRYLFGDVNVNEKENIKENISFFSPTKLNINDYDLKFSDKLKDKFIQFLEMNNMANLHTLTEQIEIVNNYLKKYTEQQIIDSLKYAISKQNKSFNPKWIKKDPDSNGFTLLTDKDVHN